MPFSVLTTAQGNITVITLRDDSKNCEAEIYSFGALLNKFSIPVNGEPVNVIDGFSSTVDAVANVSNGFKSTKLSPFVCRLKNGEYKFKEQAYKIDKFYMGNSAIHGLLFNQYFAVKETSSNEEKAFVTLHYTYNKKEEGFPFSFEMDVTYTLSLDNKLTLSTKVVNTSNTDMPLNDGWHPYFTLGTLVDDLIVQFDSKKMVEFDEGLVPTGNYLPYNTFNEAKKFGDTFLDNCFELNNTGTIVCSLKNPNNNLQLNIIPAASYPYLQIYTPPHRNSIAIENLSSVPDAFNNKIGLIVAKGGESYTFETTYQLVN